MSSKKPLTERERRRQRANQMSKAITGQRNVETQTNITYLAILAEDSKIKKVDKADKDQEALSGADELEKDANITIDDGGSTGESHGESDSSDEEEASIDHDENNQTDRKEFLFAGSGAFIKYWNYSIILLALYNSIFIPLQIFYAEDGHTEINGNIILFIDACVDLIFLIDIIIRFRTTYLDSKESYEVKDPHKIGLRYLKSNFTIDFISSVPFGEIFKVKGAGQSLFQALGLLKLLRLSRLFTTVQRANLPSDIKVYLKVIMMAIFMFVFIHLLSCFWFSVVARNQRWVQNMDFMFYAMEDAYQGHFEGDDAFIRKYFVLLYTGFYIFGVGEIVPRSDTIEFAMAFLLCAICTIGNAVIIGYMTSYTEELNKKTAELSEKLNLTNTAMLNLKLSSGLKSEINKYIY